jgi:hypothetical protein
MIEKNDWRLTNQESYLKNKELTYAHYKPYSPKWDHDHCVFCNDTFSEYEPDLHEGYCTLDNYHWICSNCFNDFKDMFNWKVVVK